MQENTEGFNENSNSEVIILPPNSHLEETLVSDDEETDNETPHSYDAKLNAKLKELGLYEDGMTIQQKEELLAVVAVSFKTAEEEKSRRQWYEEYANAALSFPEDEIEFNFQNSPELELLTKESCYSGDYNTSPAKSDGSSVCEIDSIASTSSGIVSGDNCCHMQNTNEFQHFLSNTHSTAFKTKSQPRKNRSRAISNKLALQEGNTVTSHSAVSVSDRQDIQLTNKQKKHLLEKSMSTWRPCLSPKDEPLICPSRPYSEDSEESYSEEKCNQKMFECIQDFNFAFTEVKKSLKKPSPLAKPYQLSRNGYIGRKVTKLDSMDIMVGVQEGREELLGEANASNCLILNKEPFSRTSGGAFRYAKLHRERIDNLKKSISSVNNHNSCIISQPGSICGVKKISLRFASEKCRTPEIIIEEGSDNSDISLSDECNPDVPHNSNSSRKSSYESKDKTNLVTKLPKFSNLRPDLCAGSFSGKEALSRPVDSRYSDCSTVSSVNFSTKSSGSALKTENHIDSSSKDGDLSDSSSVIDVETFDEVEEVVLKRKFLQEPITSERQTYSNRPKRLKKNTS